VKGAVTIAGLVAGAALGVWWLFRPKEFAAPGLDELPGRGNTGGGPDPFPVEFPGTGAQVGGAIVGLATDSEFFGQGEAATVEVGLYNKPRAPFEPRVSQVLVQVVRDGSQFFGIGDKVDSISRLVSLAPWDYALFEFTINFNGGLFDFHKYRLLIDGVEVDTEG